MDVAFVVVLLAVVGALLVGAVLGWWWGRPSGAPAPSPPDPATPTAPVLPDGVVEVLSVLRASALVLDHAGAVVRASASAGAYGLVRGRMVAHEQVREITRAVARDGVIRELELEVARGPYGGGTRLLGMRVAPLQTWVLVLVDDRTQVRAVEEVRRDFVVNVSHELKTPVGGLTLLAEAVEQARDDPEAVRRFARRMKVESARLTRLVSEIVDLSRLQTADQVTDPTLVPVLDCARTAVGDTALIAAGRRVTASATDPQDRLVVYGDHDLIVTAIRNLVTNAIAYSEDGTVVTVVVRRVGEVVEVAVSDQGIGISPENQQRIFERFYRVDAARSRSTGGTGLGLSIVKHICANHGGDVRVWSRPDLGSTFTMRLPAAETGGPPPVVAAIGVTGAGQLPAGATLPEDPGGPDATSGPGSDPEPTVQAPVEDR